MIEPNLKHTLCFTGHRPEKLSRSETDIKSDLTQAILNSINEGCTCFISGMARGVDLWAAEIVLEFQKKYPSIKLLCAIPYDGFEKRWSYANQQLYHSILVSSSYTKYISSSYSPDVFQKRNMWMVDNSSKVIAVFNGEKGGTKNTIDYALSKHRKIKYIQG